MATKNKNVVVIGAGIGGLTTAAILAQAGLNSYIRASHGGPSA